MFKSFLSFQFLLYFLIFAFNIQASITDIPTIKACFNESCFILDHAYTHEQKKKGLMFVTNLPEHKGMLFSWNKETFISMWMKHTYIPLDMIWIDDDYSIVHLHQQATPLDLTPIRSPLKAKYVIELNAGTIKQKGIQLNDKVNFYEYVIPKE